MNYTVILECEKKEKKVKMKDAFAEVLAKIAAAVRNSSIWTQNTLNAIERKSGRAHPDQAINVGIAESNMAGLAAGLSASGLKPLTHTFGCFSSRRAFDQTFLSIGYAKNSVVMVGSDPGVTASYNGGTHMPFEDMAIYRSVPGGKVIEITVLSCLIVSCQNDRPPSVKYVDSP
jgi:transketolase